MTPRIISLPLSCKSLVLSFKTFTEDDFQKYLNKGLGVLKKLDNIYTNSDLKGKHNLLGSTFVEKLIFDGKNCRTGKINGAVSLILNIDKALEGNKKRQDDKKIDLSRIVGYTGFEPVTPALSRQCSEPTELITRSTKALLHSKIEFQRALWRISDSNRSPLHCQRSALAK